jgi:uncharacterized protein
MRADGVTWLRAYASKTTTALLLLLLVGCSAHPRLTAEERAQIGQIAVAQVFEQRRAGIATDALNPAERLAAGALEGLHPQTWIIGGPIVTIPVALLSENKCHKSLADYSAWFSEAIVAVKPEALLHEGLGKYIAQSIGRDAVNLGKMSGPLPAEQSAIASVRGRGFDTILLIEQLEMNFSAQGSGCVPFIKVTAVFRVLRVKDGASLAAGPASTLVDAELFSPESLRKTIGAAVNKLAASVICAAGIASKCGLSKDDIDFYYRYSPVHRAAVHGQVATIRSMAAHRPIPALRDYYSRTALHVATYFKQHDAMRALVMAGEDPNALEGDGWGGGPWPGNEGYDIATIAAVADDVPTLKLALELGCKANNRIGRNNSTALIAAALLGHAEIARVLLGAGANPDAVNDLGWTALIETILLGDGGPRYIDTARALIEGGANVNKADRNGQTPLELARQRKYREIVSLLERAGAR